MWEWKNFEKKCLGVYGLRKRGLTKYVVDTQNERSNKNQYKMKGLTASVQYWSFDSVFVWPWNVHHNKFASRPQKTINPQLEKWNLKDSGVGMLLSIVWFALTQPSSHTARNRTMRSRVMRMHVVYSKKCTTCFRYVLNKNDEYARLQKENNNEMEYWSRYTKWVAIELPP